ncbi:MAG: hypothetical protein L3J72_01505, partial [Thermoplasmata archaeon]|nr:hypothetical protein [Thermoplasmata archaeon]
KVEAVGPSRYRISFDGEDGTRTQLLLVCQQVGTVRSFSGSTLGHEDAYLRLMRPESAAATKA